MMMMSSAWVWGKGWSNFAFSCIKVTLHCSLWYSNVNLRYVFIKVRGEISVFWRGGKKTITKYTYELVWKISPAGSMRSFCGSVVIHTTWGKKLCIEPCNCNCEEHRKSIPYWAEIFQLALSLSRGFYFHVILPLLATRVLETWVPSLNSSFKHSRC